MKRTYIIIGVIILIVAGVGLAQYQRYKKNEAVRNEKIASYKLKIQEDLKTKNPELYANLQKAVNEGLEKTKKNAKDQAAWLDLGVAYQSLGELDKAEEAYKKALALSPESVNGWANLAEIYKHEERFKEAKEAYLKLIENVPTEFTGYYRLAEMYAAGLEGTVEDAKKILQQGVEKTRSASLQQALDRLNREGHL